MRVARRVAIFACAAIVAGCGGGGSAGAPPVPSTPVKPASSVAVSIAIPKPAQAPSGAHRQYVSSATQSVVIVVDGANPTAFNTTPSSPNCTTSGPLAPLVCTLSVSVYQGTHTFGITEYDQQQTGTAPPWSGNVLATGTTTPQTIGANPTPINIVPDGVPATLLVIPSAGSSPVATSTTNDIYMAGGFGGIAETAKVTVATQDASGAFIIGSGAPTYSVVSSNPSLISVAAPSSSAPNTYTLTSLGLGSATLTITATGGSGGTLTQQSTVTATLYTAKLSGSPNSGPLAAGSATSTVYAQSPSMNTGGDGALYAVMSAAGVLKVANDGSTTLIDTSDPNNQAGALDVTESFSGDPLLMTSDSSYSTCYVINLNGHTVLANVSCGYPFDVRLIASTSSATVYYADSYNCGIVAYDTTTAAQNGTPIVPFTACGSSQYTPQSRPAYIPVGKFGQTSEALAFFDASCNLKVVNLSTGSFSQVAGNGSCSSTPVDGTGSAAAFVNGGGIAYDPNSDSILSMARRCTNGCAIDIRRVTANGTVTTLGTFGANSIANGFAAGAGQGAIDASFITDELTYSVGLHAIVFGGNAGVYEVKL